MKIYELFGVIVASVVAGNMLTGILDAAIIALRMKRRIAKGKAMSSEAEERIRKMFETLAAQGEEGEGVTTTHGTDRHTEGGTTVLRDPLDG